MKTKQYANMIISACVAVIIGLLTYRGYIAVSFMGEGLDGSATYALSYFVTHGIKFGHDVAFTYGPLGFLCYAKDIGGIIPITIIFWILMSVLLSFGIYILLSRSLNEKKNLVCVIAGCAVTYLSFASNTYSGGADSCGYFYLFVCIMSIMLALTNYNDSNSKIGKFFLCVSDVLICLSLFIKFSLTIQILSSVILMIAALFIIKHPAKLHFLVHIGISVFAALILYVVFYSQSIVDLFNYIKGSMEMSSGYSWAMSMHTDFDVYFIQVIILVVIYLAGFFFNLGNKMNIVLFSALAGPAFFMYKHGFVRSDGHVHFFFQGMVLILALFFLFYNTEQINETKLTFLPNASLCRCISAVLVFVAIIPIQVVEQFTVSDLYKNWNSVATFPTTYSSVKNEPCYESNNLPQEFINRIQDNSVSIYPINILYNRNNDLNYVPLYGVQAYSVYTPWLDNKTADVFVGEEKPEYIIMEIDSVDNRWFLLDTPQTSWKIRDNYYVDYYESGKFLLKKREEPIVNSVDLVKTEQYKITDVIDVSENGYVKMNTGLSFWGSIVNLLYKIPEVDMTVNYADGTTMTKRVVLQNFTSGIDLSSIVNSEAQFVDYFNYSGNLSEVSSVSFSGEGLQYFNQDVSVEYYNVNESKNDINIDTYQIYSPEISYSDIPKTKKPDASSLNLCVDSMTYNNGITAMQGWIYDSKSNNSFEEVYLHSGNALYRLRATARDDVQNAFALADNQIGFSEHIRGEISEYSIVVKPKNSDEYYEYDYKTVKRINDAIHNGGNTEPEYAEKYSYSDIVATEDIAQIEASYVIDRFEVNDNTTIAGWMVDPDSNGSYEEVYLQTGDELFKLISVERTDVQEVYSLSDANVGFEAVINEAIEDYSFVVKPYNSDEYYQVQVS